MILTGKKIYEEIQQDRIVIDPFFPSQINPNSYDFRLGSTLKMYVNHELDTQKKNPVKEVIIPEDGYLLQPEHIYLGCTVERMGSEYFVPIIRGKSSIGRLGLFVHITADLIDIGSINQWTLMMHAVQPLRIYPHMLIGQVTFWEVNGEINLYNGKYQGATGPMESLAFQDIF